MTVYSTSIHSSEFAAASQRAQGQIWDEVMRALDRTAEMASAYARTSTLYKSHTFGLRSSIQWGTQKGPQIAVGIMRASAPYAHFVENGTKPHTIEPRRKEALRFVQNGAVRFSRIVNHPGTKPRPFMAQAQDKATPILERLMQEAVARAFT